MSKEKTSEEKLHEILKDAFLNEDEGEIYTMSVERLKRLEEAKGFDEELDGFAKCLAMHFNEEPTAGLEADDHGEVKGAFSDAPDFAGGCAICTPSPPGTDYSAAAKWRLRKVLGMVASLLLVFTFVGAQVWCTAEPADANRNNTKVVQNQGDTVVINEEPFADNQVVGYKEWETDQWEMVETKAKKFLPELLIPGYIPDGYEFSQLVIEKYENGKYSVKYRFQKGEDGIFISQVPDSKQTSLENYDEVIPFSKGDILLMEDKETSMITSYANIKTAKLKILGVILEQDIVEIMEALN